jgi:hypothetical protein
MSQLSVADQHEVDSLNDDIRRLTQENKEAFSTRMRLEAEKNKLENLLTNNLMRRKDELMQVQYRTSFMYHIYLCVDHPSAGLILFAGQNPVLHK